MISLAIRIVTILCLAFILGIIYSLLDKDSFKGKDGKALFLYVVLLTIFIIVLGVCSWELLKNVNVKI